MRRLFRRKRGITRRDLNTRLAAVAVYEAQIAAAEAHIVELERALA